MQKIIPCLWFDTEAEEAANFYASIFNNTKVGSITRYNKANAEAAGAPDGSAMTVSFTLEGQKFIGLNGGPSFQFTPAISFVVNCPSKDEVDELWQQLSDGGEVLMPLDAYPFSERYGWCKDKYGVSWQVIYADYIPERKIVPSLMFVGDQVGNAETAINHYVSVFKEAPDQQGESVVNTVIPYQGTEGPDTEGTVMFADFTLAGQHFAAMDSAHEHDFTFTEATSFQIMCETQAEVDHFWNKLSAVPEAEACGWLKDQYGVSWQIVPTMLPELLETTEGTQAERVTSAMMQMKKIDIAALQEAAEHTQ